MYFVRRFPGFAHPLGTRNRCPPDTKPPLLNGDISAHRIAGWWLRTAEVDIMPEAIASEVLRAYGLPTVGAPLPTTFKVLFVLKVVGGGGSYRRIRGPLAIAFRMRQGRVATVA